MEEKKRKTERAKERNNERKPRSTEITKERKNNKRKKYRN